METCLHEKQYTRIVPRQVLRKGADEQVYLATNEIAQTFCITCGVVITEATIHYPIAPKAEEVAAPEAEKTNE